MTNRPGFTLLEILLSLMLSSFVITILMQFPRHFHNIVGISQQRSTDDYRVGRALKQLERDISCACMPTFFSDEKVVEKKTEQASNDQEKPVEPQFFVGTHEEDKIASTHFKSLSEDSKRIPHFKNMSFISTSPLETYEKASPRLLRVTYELEKNKEKSTRQNDVFTLFRTETDKLKTSPTDKIMASDEWKESRILVMDGIRECFVQYSYTDTDKKKTTEEAVKKEKHSKPKHKFEWGQAERDKKHVPELVMVQVALWDDKIERSKPFSLKVPVFAQAIASGNRKKKKNAGADTKNTQNPTPPQPVKNKPKRSVPGVVRK